MNVTENRNEFTLIELLLVIAIIAILAGMLIPALGRVKGIAKASGCVNNARQVMIAIFNYAGNNADSMPFATLNFMISGTGHNFQHLLNGADFWKHDITPNGVCLTSKKILPPEIFECPERSYRDAREVQIYGTGVAPLEWPNWYAGCQIPKAGQGVNGRVFIHQGKYNAETKKYPAVNVKITNRNINARTICLMDGNMIDGIENNEGPSAASLWPHPNYTSIVALMDGRVVLDGDPWTFRDKVVKAKEYNWGPVRYP